MKKQGGITLIALVITIIVLLILAGISLTTLTGNNGIITKAQDASIESSIKTVEELARLAYATATIDKRGAVTEATAYSQIFKELTEKGYEVVSVGGTINGIYIKDSTGANKTSTILQQAGTETVKVELDIEEGSQKQFVKIGDKYHEIQIEGENIIVLNTGIVDILGENHTITLKPGTTDVSGSMKVKMGDEELISDTKIVSGTQLTIEAGQTKTTYTITAEVEGYSTTLQVTISANPTYATDLTLSADATEVEAGEQVQITATKIPTEGTTDTISWRVISGSATIDTTGKLTVASNATGGSTIEVGATLVRSDGTVTDVEEKTIEFTVKTTVGLADLVEIGDYVVYSVETGEFSVTENTGISEAQKFNPSSYDSGWRVLSKNTETKEIDIVSAGSVGTLSLYGVEGATRGLLVLDEVCSKYINTSLANSARCIGRESSFEGVLTITDASDYGFYEQYGMELWNKQDTTNIQTVEPSGFSENYWLGAYANWGDPWGGGLSVFYIDKENYNADGANGVPMYGIGNQHWGLSYCYWMTYLDTSTNEYLETPSISEQKVTNGVRPVITINGNVKIEDNGADGSLTSPWKLYK